MPNFRVYYNRRSDYPFIWSVDEGTQETEVNVTDVELTRVSAKTRFDRHVPRGSTETPSCWFEVEYAILTVKDNIAYFFHDPNWRQPPLANP